MKWTRPDCFGSQEAKLRNKVNARSNPLMKINEVDPTGFEPAISSVTGWHVGPLHHGSVAAVQCSTPALSDPPIVPDARIAPCRTVEHRISSRTLVSRHVDALWAGKTVMKPHLSSRTITGRERAPSGVRSGRRPQCRVALRWIAASRTIAGRRIPDAGSGRLPKQGPNGGGRESTAGREARPPRNPSAAGREVRLREVRPPPSASPPPPRSPYGTCPDHARACALSSAA